MSILSNNRLQPTTIHWHDTSHRIWESNFFLFSCSGGNVLCTCPHASRLRLNENKGEHQRTLTNTKRHQATPHMRNRLQWWESEWNNERNFQNLLAQPWQKYYHHMEKWFVLVKIACSNRTRNHKQLNVYSRIFFWCSFCRQSRIIWFQLGQNWTKICVWSVRERVKLIKRR